MRRCPRCKSELVSISRRRTYWEAFCLPLLVRSPLRCCDCLHRFYGFSFDAETRARIGSSFFVLLLVLGLSWGMWKVIDAVGYGLTGAPSPGAVRPGPKR